MLFPCAGCHLHYRGKWKAPDRCAESYVQISGVSSRLNEAWERCVLYVCLFLLQRRHMWILSAECRHGVGPCVDFFFCSVLFLHTSTHWPRSARQLLTPVTCLLIICTRAIQLYGTFDKAGLVKKTWVCSSWHEEHTCYILRSPVEEVRALDWFEG